MAYEPQSSHEEDRAAQHYAFAHALLTDEPNGDSSPTTTTDDDGAAAAAAPTVADRLSTSPTIQPQISCRSNPWGDEAGEAEEEALAADQAAHQATTSTMRSSQHAAGAAVLALPLCCASHRRRAQRFWGSDHPIPILPSGTGQGDQRSFQPLGSNKNVKELPSSTTEQPPTSTQLLSSAQRQEVCVPCTSPVLGRHRVDDDDDGDDDEAIFRTTMTSSTKHGATQPPS